MILSKNDKKIKKDNVAMVVKDLKSKAGQRKPKEDNSDDEGDEDLYNLVRGGKKSSLVIQRLKQEEDFVPTRNLRSVKERVIMMIFSDESNSSDYVPKKRKIEKEEEVTKSKNDGKSGSDSSLPNIFTMSYIPDITKNASEKGEAEAKRSEVPMASDMGQGDSQPLLRPRDTWIAKGDARSDKEADAEWHKANSLLFGPSYEA